MHEHPTLLRHETRLAGSDSQCHVMRGMFCCQAQDGAIAAMIDAKLEEKCMFVSANVVGDGLLSCNHAQLGALEPFNLPQGLRNGWPVSYM
jgi:hypothetical protein